MNGASGLRLIDRVLDELEMRTSALVFPVGLYGFEQSSVIFNQMIESRPAAVVRPRSVSEIALIVEIFEKYRVNFTVRAGGHSIAGACVSDGAIMLDLSLLRKVRIDPTSGVATVEPGALWGDFDRATTRFGLASTGGIVSHTGVAGLILGGGLGWLMGEKGLAADNLIALRVIDASLQVRDVDVSHPDISLFRGSGRALGVVTEFKVQCSPIPAMVTVGRAVLPVEYAAEIWCSISQSHSAIPPWLTFSPAISNSGGRWFAVLDLVATRTPSRVWEVVVAIVPSIAKALTLRETSYVEAQSMFDTALRFDRRNYWKSIAKSELDVDVITSLSSHAMRSPSPQSFLSVDVLHNAAQTVPASGSSYGLRDKPFVVLLNTIWTNPQDDAQNVKWCREGFQILTEGAAEDSTYSNYFSADDVGSQGGSHSTIAMGTKRKWVPQGLVG